MKRENINDISVNFKILSDEEMKLIRNEDIIVNASYHIDEMCAMLLRLTIKGRHAMRVCTVDQGCECLEIMEKYDE